MPVHVQTVLLAEANQDVTSDPHVIANILGSLREDLEFPLTLCDFGIDTLEIDSRVKDNVNVLFSNLPSDRPNAGHAHTAVVGTLRSWVTLFGESEWSTVLVEEILLLKTDPEIFFVFDVSPCV